MKVMKMNLEKIKEILNEERSDRESMFNSLELSENDRYTERDLGVALAVLDDLELEFERVENEESDE